MSELAKSNNVTQWHPSCYLKISVMYDASFTYKTTFLHFTRSCSNAVMMRLYILFQIYALSFLTVAWKKTVEIGQHKSKISYK